MALVMMAFGDGDGARLAKVTCGSLGSPDHVRGVAPPTLAFASRGCVRDRHTHSPITMSSQNDYFGKGSVVVPSDDDGPVRRLAILSDRLVTQPVEGIDVMPDVIDYAAGQFGNREAMGWRSIVSVHEEEKEVKKTVGGKEVTETKKWKYFELSDYQYLSYLEVKERICELARGLVHYDIKKEDIFNVYSQTRRAVSLFLGLLCHRADMRATTA